MLLSVLVQNRSSKWRWCDKSPNTKSWSNVLNDHSKWRIVRWTPRVRSAKPPVGTTFLTANIRVKCLPIGLWRRPSLSLRFTLFPSWLLSWLCWWSIDTTGLTRSRICWLVLRQRHFSCLYSAQCLWHTVCSRDFMESLRLRDNNSSHWSSNCFTNGSFGHFA